MTLREQSLRHEAAKMLERYIVHVVVQAGGATSSGPAAGSGFEMILQGFNWESYRNNWYKVCKDAAISPMHKSRADSSGALV